MKLDEPVISDCRPPFELEILLNVSEGGQIWQTQTQLSQGRRELKPAPFGTHLLTSLYEGEVKASLANDYSESGLYF